MDTPATTSFTFDYYDSNNSGSADSESNWRVVDNLSLIFSVIGILANTSFIVVYFNITALQTFTNLYLLHLAVADLLYLVLSFVLVFIKLLVSPTTFFTLLGTKESCTGTYLFGGTMQFSSVFIVALVCIERYLAICRPLRSLQRNTKLRCYVQLSVAWVAGILFTLPGVIVFCGGYSNEIKVDIVVLVLESLPYITSVCITLVLYSIISIKLMKRNPGNFELGKERRKENRDVVLLLVITTVMFFILVVPNRVTSFWQLIVIGIQGRTEWFNLARTETFIMFVILNSVINVFIYNMTSNMFRRSFKAVFCCGEEPIRRSDTTKYRYTSRSHTTNTQLTPCGTPSPGNIRKLRVNSLGQQNKRLSTGESFELTPRTTSKFPVEANGNLNIYNQHSNGSGSRVNPGLSTFKDNGREMNETTTMIDEHLDSPVLN